MPLHRFFNELDKLEKQNINGVMNMLVVGTFNAADQSGLRNDANWFYGRKENEFWYLFPQLLGHSSLHRREHPDKELEELTTLWKSYCLTNKIIIVDVYKSIGGEIANHSDNEILNPTIFEVFDYQNAFKQCNFKTVLFTRKMADKKSVLGKLMNEMSIWFEKRGSKVIHMVSPSYAYPKSKEFKLLKWKELYDTAEKA